MKFLNEYPLSLSTNYVHSWGLWEAVRELIQNALDSDGGHSINYDRDSEELSITSYGQKLEPRNLLLGGSSKTGDNKKIGEHGEGAKLAALVLIRGGYGLTIENQNLKWQAEIKYSDLYKEELLTFLEYDTGSINKNLVVIISGIPYEEYEEIAEKCLHLSFYPSAGEQDIKETSYGNILVNHGGSVYVSGLYVCDSDTKHSYDIKPQYISLDRDRRSVSSWDSSVLFAKMWAEAGISEEQAEEVLNGAEDYRLSSYSWSSDDNYKQSVIDHALDKYGEAYFVSSQNEYNEAKELGYDNIIILNETACGIIMDSGLYSPPEPEGGLKEQLDPEEYLKEFIEKLKEEGYEAVCSLPLFDALLEESEKWIIK